MVKGSLFKMEWGSQEGRALTHTPLIAAGVTRRKKKYYIYFNKGGHFPHGNFISKEEKGGEGEEGKRRKGDSALTTTFCQ